MLKKWPILMMMMLAVGMASAATHTSTTPNQDDKGCYLISDADELYGFAKLVNAGNATACGKLDANIVVNTNVLGTNNANVNFYGQLKNESTPTYSWTPIGTSGTPFHGSFDGQGYTISGLYFYQQSENFGLFGFIGGNNIDVTIKNLNISDSYFGGNVYVGSLVGHIVADGELTIENVSSNAAVSSSYDDGTGYIGGLIGYVENATANSLNLTITGVHNDGLVIGKDYSGSVHNYVGGLVGGTSGLVSVTVANSFNTGNITGSSYVGGLIGGVKNPTSNTGITLNITNAYNTGTIKGSSINNIGGLVGRIEVDYSKSSVEIRNCYNYGSVDGFAITNTSTTTLGQISFTPINCYYLAEESNGFGMSATDFADGTVFALLRSGEDGEVWRQYENDAYPTFAAKTGTDAPSPMHVAVLHYSETDSVVIAYTAGTAFTLPTTLPDGSIVVGDWYKSNNLSGDTYTQIAATENDDLAFYAKAMKLDSDGYYEIADADMLFKFAELVNTQNSTYGSAKAKLTADIVVNQNVLTDEQGNSKVNSDGSYNGTAPTNVWTPIGTSSTSAFKGSFNGKGHTISGLYFNNSTTSNVGLFGCTNGAVTIDSVGVVDSYFRGRQYVGGLIGYTMNAGKLSLKNSYNTGSVTGTNYVGGLVGGNVSSQSFNLMNSYNTGSVNGNQYVGGLVGKGGEIKFSYNIGLVNGSAYAGGLAGSGNSIADSYNTGLVKNGEALGNAMIGYGCDQANVSGKISNSYYLEGSGSDCGPNAFSGTTEEFANGLVAIKLHQFDKIDIGDGSVWGQIVGADKTPLLTGEIVFPITLDNSDNCYEISNADDLYIFAAIVNSGFKSDACGKLTADIKVNEHVLADANGVPKVNSNGAYAGSTTGLREWTPIGNSDYPFIGTFDGDGHTISGLYFNDDAKRNVGLFGYVESSESVDVSIKNVGLEDSYFKAEGKVGGVVGLVGDNVDVKIENVYNAAVVTDGGRSGYVGGIVGEFWTYAPSTLNIFNSYNSGVVFGNNSVGGLVGGVDGDDVVSSVSVKNCYNYGALSAFNNQGETLIGSVEGSKVRVNISDTYYLENSNLQSTHGGTEMSVTEFADGTVYAALHSAEGGEDWRQYKNDAYPTFAAKTGTDAPSPMHVATLHYSETDSVVIAYTEGTAKSLPTEDKSGNPITGWTTSADGTGDAITEIPTSATGDLKLYPKVKTFEPNAEGYYEIATADDLYKFAEIVNNGTAVGSGTELGVKAKLIADICVNACGEGESVLKADGTLNGDGSSFTPWTPIGYCDEDLNCLPFTGIFDGQGYTISGLYFNDLDGVNVGLFGYVSGEGETVSISNVGVEDSYFNAQSAVGGVVGFVENVALDMENVYNAAVVAGASFVGGIVGYVSLYDPLTLSMVNVYNVGSVIGSEEGQTGGLVGDFMNDSEESKITIENSYNYGNVGGGNPLVGTVENDYEGYVAVMVTNSFYLGSSSSGDYGTVKSSDEFADGTVLIALRSGEGGSVWVQNPGDKYPTIDVNASTNAKTIVLDWTSADDSTTLADAGYTDGAMVIVKDGKQFYAGGAIYEGILSAGQVAAIGSNKLYPISGVELETVDGKLVAILDGRDREEGGTAPAIMIPFDLVVDKVFYKREMTAGIYKTVMLPFNVDNLKQDAYNNYGFYRFTSMDENVDGYRYMAMVYRVRLLYANMPYIMKNIGETDTEGIVFEGDGRITLNTVSSGFREFSATSNDSITWSMKGVYENKVWETGDPEIGSAYLFAGQKKDGYKIGEYAKLGAGASLQPMRMYLLKGALAQLNRPGMFGSVDHYGSPESIGVRFVDDEEFDEGEETMVEKRITVIPTVIKSNRWFDMKGRALDSKPTAKGNYYYNGKRITIK